MYNCRLEDRCEYILKELFPGLPDWVDVGQRVFPVGEQMGEECVLSHYVMFGPVVGTDYHFRPEDVWNFPRFWKKDIEVQGFSIGDKVHVGNSEHAYTIEDFREMDGRFTVIFEGDFLGDTWIEDIRLAQ